MTKMTTQILPWSKEKMQNYRWLDEYLTSQPGAEKEFQPAWQAYKYMLHGKMFAYIGVNDKNERPIVTVKMAPADSDRLRGEYADIVPGYYMNKLHWSTVYLDGDVPQEVVQDIVQTAHKLVLTTLSKKVQQEIMG